jgi:hypothetical protein
MDVGVSGAGATGSRSAASRDTMDWIKRVFVRSLHLNLSEEDLDYEQRLDELVGLDSLAVNREFGAMTFKGSIIHDHKCDHLGCSKSRHFRTGRHPTSIRADIRELPSHDRRIGNILRKCATR